jgi:hypothetical protein
MNRNDFNIINKCCHDTKSSNVFSARDVCIVDSNGEYDQGCMHNRQLKVELSSSTVYPTTKLHTRFFPLSEPSITPFSANGISEKIVFWPLFSNTIRPPRSCQQIDETSNELTTVSIVVHKESLALAATSRRVVDTFKFALVGRNECRR